MADLELANGRKRFCLSKTSTEFGSLKRVKHKQKPYGVKWKVNL